MKINELPPLKVYLLILKTRIVSACGQVDLVFMPSTSEKLRVHIGLGLSVSQSVGNTLAAEKLKNRLC